MFEFIFVAAAFAISLTAVMRSLGWGIASVIAIGYLHGMVRSNYVGFLTTFFFDFAILGFYIGAFASPKYRIFRSIGDESTKHFLILILWPLILSLLPINDLLVQLVSLRAHAWMLPAALIATQIRSSDINTITKVLWILNPFALFIAYIIYSNGLGAIHPRNAVTELMYQSEDIAGGDFHRIPACFLNAHGYGLTMMLSLPFVVSSVLSGKNWLPRLFSSASALSAVVGIFLCGGRQPVVVFVGAFILFVIISRAQFYVIVPLGILLAIAAFVVSGDERMQRVYTLEDTEMVMERVHLSANESFFRLMLEYPLGAGMGSAFGNSIPYFLASRAPKPIGMENEYAHIMVDQGVIGLAFWLIALIWLYWIPPLAVRGTSQYVCVQLIYCISFSIWATAFIGVGIQSAVPGGFMLMTQMGILAGLRRNSVKSAPNDRAGAKPSAGTLGNSSHGMELQTR